MFKIFDLGVFGIEILHKFFVIACGFLPTFSVLGGNRTAANGRPNVTIWLCMIYDRIRKKRQMLNPCIPCCTILKKDCYSISKGNRERSYEK